MTNKEQQTAFSFAIRLLAGREYCKAEMRKRLEAKVYTEACIAHVLAQLIEHEYLSDQRFAEVFLRSRMVRGEAPWLAARKAAQRGVQQTALDDALTLVTTAFDALASCQTLLARRDPQAHRVSDRRVWQRHLRYLRSKGYTMDVILQAMNEGIHENI